MKPNTFTQILLCLIIIFATQTTAQSCNFYLSVNGNDTSGDGTIGNPYETLERALSENNGPIVAICLEDGVYIMQDATVPDDLVTLEIHPTNPLGATLNDWSIVASNTNLILSIQDFFVEGLFTRSGNLTLSGSQVSGNARVEANNIMILSSIFRDSSLHFSSYDNVFNGGVTFNALSSSFGNGSLAIYFSFVTDVSFNNCYFTNSVGPTEDYSSIIGIDWGMFAIPIRVSASFISTTFENNTLLSSANYSTHFISLVYRPHPPSVNITLNIQDSTISCNKIQNQDVYVPLIDIGNYEEIKDRLQFNYENININDSCPITCAESGGYLLFGLLNCQQCEPGSFSTIKNATFCTLCSPGYAQSKYGSSKCIACEGQTIAQFNGSVSCQECALGYTATGKHTICGFNNGSIPTYAILIPLIVIVLIILIIAACFVARKSKEYYERVGWN